METGIPVSVWWNEDERDLETALDILAATRAEQEKQSSRDRG